MGHSLGSPNRPLSGAQFWTWDPGDEGWWRLYHQDYHTPKALSRRTFGPLLRFDHHEPDVSGRAQEDPNGRSVIYLGQNRLTCEAEALWDQPPAPGASPGGPRIASVCRRYRFAQLRPTAPITLVNLVGVGCDAIGALPELATGSSDIYPISQEWAQAIYEDTGVQGVYYPGAHDLGMCMVLWDNAPPLEIVRDKGRPRDLSLHDPRLWDRVLVEYSINNRALKKIRAFECPKCRAAGYR
ncbi:MAG: hypothetical protein QOH16_3521 [Gaiellaceae bacterium]|nr:hypothetical protein [Gaiellaceae bacterium]